MNNFIAHTLVKDCYNQHNIINHQNILITQFQQSANNNNMVCEKSEDY